MNFSSKLRILINVSIIRRDIGFCFLLKRILESHKFEVFLSSPANNHKNIKLWKPELFITQTISSTTNIRRKFPNLKIIVLDPEGFLFKL